MAALSGEKRPLEGKDAAGELGELHHQAGDNAQQQDAQAADEQGQLGAAEEGTFSGEAGSLNHMTLTTRR